MATIIFDGSYLLHRVMHVPQIRFLSTSIGKPSGGTFAFIKSVRSTLYERGDIDVAVVVFDKGRSKRRLTLYPEYKANRVINEEVDPDGLTYIFKFKRQLVYLRFILPRLGIKVVELPCREGDDVISLLLRLLKADLSIVASDDRDMYQLVESNVHVWRPIAQDLVTLENFEECAGYERKHCLLRMSILGDATDNISKINGVGPKTVDTLLSECEDIGDYPFEEFFEYVLEFGNARAQAIPENPEIILRNYELIDLTKERFTKDECEYVHDTCTAPSQFDVLAVKNLFEALEYFSLIDDFNHWVTRFQLLV